MRRSRRTAPWPSSGASRSSRSPTTSTSTPRCPPTGSRRSPIASATSARPPRAGRTAGSPSGSGSRSPTSARYEDEIRGWLRRHPHDYVIGSVHISARSPYKAGRVAGFVAGRPLADIVAPYFDEIVGAAQSGLFDTIGHLDFVKRYLVPHVMPADLAAAPELYEPPLVALVESGTSLEVNASGLRQLPRETYPSAAIVARYRELGGRHVTIGSDAHRTEWFSYGLGQAYRQASDAGFEALTFRRGGDRIQVPVPGRARA